MGYATASEAVCGGDEVSSLPISSTNNQLIPCNHWI